MAYAIIKIGGKQYQVAQGDVIEVDKIDAVPGSTAQFLEVLFLSGSEGVTTDAAALENASVTGEILAQTKAPKVIAYKYRRRKGYHRTVGHRRQLTKVKITAITA